MHTKTMFFMWFTQPMGSDCDAALGSYDVPGGRCVCGVRAPEAAVGARGGPTKIFSFTFNIYNIKITLIMSMRLQLLSMSSYLI